MGGPANRLGLPTSLGPRLAGALLLAVLALVQLPLGLRVISGPPAGLPLDYFRGRENRAQFLARFVPYEGLTMAHWEIRPAESVVALNFDMMNLITWRGYLLWTWFQGVMKQDSEACYDALLRDKHARILVVGRYSPHISKYCQDRGLGKYLTPDTLFAATKYVRIHDLKQRRWTEQELLARITLVGSPGSAMAELITGQSAPSCLMATTGVSVSKDIDVPEGTRRVRVVVKASADGARTGIIEVWWLGKDGNVLKYDCSAENCFAEEPAELLSADQAPAGARTLRVAISPLVKGSLRLSKGIVDLAR